MTTERQEPVDAKGSPDSGATPVGQVFAGIERVTRRLPAVVQRRPPRPPRPSRPGPSREQIASLIEALGDSAHPLHVTAVDELTALGPAVVPAICEALSPDRPWLTVYRAAEVAGRISDGRVTGPLIQALNHPNSNVRWSAVRALSQIGDVRALLELRRVAQHDQGRTSWGESVSGAAQSALTEIGRRSVWGQSLELIKTAVTAVLMIFALILAFSVVTRLREELDTFGLIIPGQTQIPQFELPTAVPTTAPDEDPLADTQSAPAPTAAAQPTSEAVFAPTANPLIATSTITGTVRQDANVRPLPGTDNTPVGRLAAGDEVVFVARTADSVWFLVRLGERRNGASTIATPDGTGWINQSLVSPPAGELPVQQLPPLAPTASP
jgi:hypothetical protein